MTKPGPETSTAVDYATLDQARRLSGHTYLSPTAARERYAAVLQLLAPPGRTHDWLAAQLGCSPSNVSRIVRIARAALTAAPDRATLGPAMGREQQVQDIGRVAEPVPATAGLHPVPDVAAAQVPVDGAGADVEHLRDLAQEQPGAVASGIQPVDERQPFGVVGVEHLPTSHVPTGRQFVRPLLGHNQPKRTNQPTSHKE